MRKVAALLLFIFVAAVEPRASLASTSADRFVYVSALLRVSHSIAANAGRAKQSAPLSQSARGFVVVLLQEAAKTTKTLTAPEGKTTAKGLYPLLAKHLGELAEDAAAIPVGPTAGDAKARWSKVAEEIGTARDKLLPSARGSAADFDAKSAAATLRFFLGADGRATTARFVGGNGLVRQGEVLGMASELVVELGRAEATKPIGLELAHALDDAKKPASAPCSPPHCSTAPAFAEVLRGVGPIGARAAGALGLGSVLADLDRIYMPPI